MLQCLIFEHGECSSATWYSYLLAGCVITVLAISFSFAFLPVRQRNVSIRGPLGFPILGCIIAAAPTRILDSLRRFTATYGTCFQMKIFGKRMVILGDAELGKEFLAKRPKYVCRDSGTNYPSEVTGVDCGLFFAKGHIWSRARRITVPFFSKQNIAHKLRRIYDEAVGLATHISQFSDNELEPKPLDFQAFSFAFTLRVITKVSLGANLNDVEASNYFFTSGQFAEDVRNSFQFFFEMVLFPLPLWAWYWNPFNSIEKLAVAGQDRINKYCQALIDDTRNSVRTRERANSFSDVPSGVSTSMIEDLIGKYELVPQLNRERSDQEVLAQVKTYIIAGSETTAVAIGWMAYYLSQSRDVMLAVQAEADVFVGKVKEMADVGEELGNHQHDPSIDDMYIMCCPQAMPICHAVFKESLRLASPAPFVTGELEADVNSLTLSNGLQMHSGDVVLVYFDGIMRQNEVFGLDCDEFNPHRWLTSDKDRLARMNDCFMTFGSGARMCPGRVLANLEAIIAIAVLANQFDFKLACPVPEVKRILRFTATMDKLPMTFTPRKTT